MGRGRILFATSSLTRNGNLNWAALAYAALADDVNDALSRLDTDLADDEDEDDSDTGDDDERSLASDIAEDR